ncbi:MAG: tripartite tricarboxylate transporter permease [Synergistaceae bacterium]|jgi:putative tricarboxylic transport membrane protein|nr:tripartite tricarboxylate transporter permease [Synergistaceae bacterium]
MMDQLLHGFATAMSLQNLLWCAVGCVVGTAIGVLPGLGPVGGMAILFPFCTSLEPLPALIMMAAVFYGSQYGGSTTAILINVPGEASSAITAVDGYALTKMGRPESALAIAAISSFIAGTLSLLPLTFVAPRVAMIGLKTFGPAENFSLVLFAFTALLSISGRKLCKGIVSICLGLMLISIGVDPVAGSFRFTFHNAYLMRGFDFVSVCVGLFAFSEVMLTLETKLGQVITSIKGWMCTLQDLKDCAGAFWRSTVIGFFTGIIPGMNVSVAALLAYDIEKRVSKHPETFGSGAIEGVAAAEGANNSATSGAMVPLMALGLPPTASMAILFGAFTIFGLTPGPTLFTQKPDVAFAIIASMYLGNVMLLIMNLPLVSIWARMATIPYAVMAPVIVIFSLVGAFTIRYAWFDVFVAIAFGFIGYFMKKFDYPHLPVIIAMVLGNKMEAAFGQALSLGGPRIFFVRPVSLGLLILSITTLIWFSVRKYASLREVEDDT